MRVLVHETLPGVEERLFAQFKKDSSILRVCGVAGTKSAQAEERVSPARCSVISRETLATLNAVGTVGSRLVPTVFQGRRNAARGFKSTITNRGVFRNVEFRYRATKKPPCSLFGSQLHCRLVCNIVASAREAT